MRAIKNTNLVTVANGFSFSLQTKSNWELRARVRRNLIIAFGMWLTEQKVCELEKNLKMNMMKPNHI